MFNFGSIMIESVYLWEVVFSGIYAARRIFLNSTQSSSSLPEKDCHASELLKRAIPIGSKIKQVTKRIFPPCQGKNQLKICPNPQRANRTTLRITILKPNHPHVFGSFIRILSIVARYEIFRIKYGT